MGEIKGFLKYDRLELRKESVKKRITHYNEFLQPPTDEELKLQAARCMDCGVPFCETGCPVDNLIPEWNDLVYHNNWKESAMRLLSTNNFPEFTGRVCPAPCESSCVLSINKPAVTIKNIEISIIEKAFENGWIKPNPPKERTNKSIAIVGSGPAGLATAEQLNRLGHIVTVFEKNEVLGGLLALGIPDFKLDKTIILRRTDLMQAEGVKFKTNINIGVDIKISELKNNFDAVVLCGGSEEPRNLNVEGRELNGIHFAMDFLKQQNRRNGNRSITENEIIVTGKKVVVIGGGDTGADCVGTSIRQGAKSVINLELMLKPPAKRGANNPWPEWAFIDREATSHEEGCKREFAVMTKSFLGNNGKVEKLKLVRLKFETPNPKSRKRAMTEITNSEFEIDADIVILALGFLGTQQNNLLSELKIKTNQHNNVMANNNYMTNVDGIFTAGDMRIGQSLVVHAINEGRNTANYVNKYLQ